jgi:hypothetical protein
MINLSGYLHVNVEEARKGTQCGSAQSLLPKKTGAIPARMYGALRQGYGAVYELSNTAHYPWRTV